MKIITLILIILISNIITFIYTIINSKNIIRKIELYISKLMFKKIIKNAEKKAEDIDNLTFKDIFEEE